ncbi:MAG: DUF1080 domain-containing protein [Akkermansiaceae bacterium]|nr:DUF1080 domain-containing protein [Akkermansiaceae bacterium]
MRKTLLPAACSLVAAMAPVFAADPDVLFDGKDLSRWTLKKPGGWIITGGELHPAGKGSGFIWSKDKFEDFVLHLEFKMSPQCNSGVFFRTDPGNPVQGGFEIQVMDTAAKDKMGKHDCGALYDAMPPSSNAAKPAGEWNSMQIACIGPKIKVTLNGTVVVDVNIDDWSEPRRNPDGSRNKFKAALKDLPRNNHIGLQYHGHPVWYRNIRIEKR